MTKLSHSGARLRGMDRNDLGQVLVWRNHPDVRQYMFNSNEIEIGEHAAWFESVSKNSAREVYIFEMGGIARGFVQFDGVQGRGVSNWGFYVAPDAQKGTGHVLGIKALNHAFNNLGLHKVCGQALAGNHASIGFHLKLGFMHEGVLREHHWTKAGFKDIYNFGILSEEWIDKV